MAELDAYIGEVQGRRRRKRAYLILFGIFLVLYATALGASWLLLWSPFFRVQSFVLSGNETVSGAAITDLLHARIFHGKFTSALLGFNNLLIWPAELTEKDLSLLPTVKAVHIAKDYKKRTISVAVEERKPYAIWCGVEDTSLAAPSACFWFDDDGVTFKHALSAEGSLIFAVHDYSGEKAGLGSRILPQDEAQNLLSIIELLKLSGLSIKEISLKQRNLEELEVTTWNGPKLYFSLRFKTDNLLPVIQDFMAKPSFKKTEYIDFRVEKRVYYK